MNTGSQVVIVEEAVQCTIKCQENPGISGNIWKTTSQKSASMKQTWLQSETLLMQVKEDYDLIFQKNGEGVEMLNFPPVPPIPEYNGPLPKHHIARPVPFEARDLER
jgi:hypothetical protein